MWMLEDDKSGKIEAYERRNRALGVGISVPLTVLCRQDE